MEIQKVFSDYYDTERMYSVIMNERELRLFAAAKDADEELDPKVLAAIADSRNEYSHSKLKNSLGFGALGAALGTGIGVGVGHVVGKKRLLGKHDLRGAKKTLLYPLYGNLIGGTLGTGYGYYRGKKKQEKAQQDYEEALSSYLNNRKS